MIHRVRLFTFAFTFALTSVFIFSATSLVPCTSIAQTGSNLAKYRGLNPAYLVDAAEPLLKAFDGKNFIHLADPDEIMQTPLPTDPIVLESLRRATQALLMADTGSVVFTGMPGAGKSYRLRLMLAYLAQKGPNELRNRLYFLADASAFGARDNGNAGTIEARIRDIVTLAKIIPITLVIDELHVLDGAGTHSKSNTDVLEMLKEPLASGDIKIIGATTDFEYESTISARPALSQRFLRVPVGEPTTEEVRLILQERHKTVMGRQLAADVIDGILQISQVFGGNSAEPRRSLKLLEYMMAQEKMTNAPIKTKATLISIASEYYSMDLNVFLDAKKNEWLIQQAELLSNEKIIGMAPKISEVFKSVRYWMSRTDRNAPLSLLIYGGKGAGKTFFSSSIADSLKYKFFKISLPSMTSVEALNSQIATQLEMYPFTLFLVDEVDKADIRLQRAFLSILDSPSFNQRKVLGSGNNGPVVSVSTKNAIFIFTSNAGEEFATQGVTSEIAKERIAATQLVDKYLIDRVRKAIAFTAPNLDGLKLLIGKKWREVNKQLGIPADQLPTEEVITQKILAQIEVLMGKSEKPSIGFGSSSSTADVQWEKLSIRYVEAMLADIGEDVLADSRRTAVDTTLRLPAPRTCVELFRK